MTQLSPQQDTHSRGRQHVNSSNDSLALGHYEAGSATTLANRETGRMRIPESKSGEISDIPLTKSKGSRNVKKSARPKVSTVASREPVIIEVDSLHDAETIFKPAGESETDSNNSKLKQPVNKNYSDPSELKSKKVSSRSQAKSKNDPQELLQINKQQSDCIIDLERRINNFYQYNQILQKWLNMVPKLDKEDKDTPESHGNAYFSVNPQIHQNQDGSTNETKGSHSLKTGLVFCPLICQMMIDNKSMENRLRELELNSSINQAIQMRHIPPPQAMYPNQMPMTPMQLSAHIMRSPIETSTYMYPPTHLHGFGSQLPGTTATGGFPGIPRSYPLYQRPYAGSIHCVPVYRMQGNLVNHMQHGYAPFSTGTNLQYQRIKVSI